jgi:hypothetical protein
MPAKATHRTLSDAIANALYEVKAYNLEDECVRFGLPAKSPNEDDPMASKLRYVERRLSKFTWDDLVALGWRVNNDYETPELTHLLNLTGLRGVEGSLKNLIFAANGPKPRIVFTDALNNDIKLVENDEYCLVYDRPLPEEGLTWQQLVSWWSHTQGCGETPEREVARNLYRRLSASLTDNEAERLLFEQYCKRYGAHGFDIPALIPQVYLHYDPYTKRTGATLPRQRMDFLLLLPSRRRIVLELDGKQHYAEDDGKASPRRYAEMVREDRELRLAGYEVYRFGGREFMGEQHPRPMLDKFFDALLGT